MNLRALIGDRIPGVTALLLVAVLSHDVAAQVYPNTAIAPVVPYAAGGDGDASGRNLAAVALKCFGQPEGWDTALALSRQRCSFAAT